METGFVALIVTASIIVGAVLGMIIERHRKRKKDSQGILFVDCSNPEYDPTLFLNATVPIEEIVTKKQVIFDVNVVR